MPLPNNNTTWMVAPFWAFSMVLLIILFWAANPLFCYAATEQTTPTPKETSFTDRSLRIQAIEQKSKIIKQRNYLLKKQLNELSKQRKKVISELSVKTVDQHMVDKAILDTALANANLDGAQIGHAEAQQMIDASIIKIRNLENELRNTTLGAGKTNEAKEVLRILQSELNFQREVLLAQQKQLEAAEQAQTLAQQIYQLERDWSNQLQGLYEQQKLQQKQADFLQQEAALEQEQQLWLDKLVKLNESIQGNTSAEVVDIGNRERLQLEVFEAQEKSNLLHLELVLLRLKHQVARTDMSIEEEYSVTQLNESIVQVDILLKEVHKLRGLIEKKLALIELKRKLDKQGGKRRLSSPANVKFAEQLLQSLENSYQQSLLSIEGLQHALEQSRADLQKELTRALARRQGLPGFSLSAWATLGQKLILMPELALQALDAIWLQVKRGFSSLTFWQIIFILILETVLLTVWHMARRYLDKLLSTIEQSKQSIADNTKFAVVKLLSRNVTTLFVFAGLFVFIWFANLPIASITPIILLMLVWLAFKIIIGLARITLLESVGVASGSDVKLYHNLKRVFIAGGVLTMLTVLAHQLPVGYEVSDFFNRLFMLFLLFTAVLLLRWWRVAPDLLRPYVEDTRPYFMRIVKLLSFLFPLTLLSTAIIGFLGYVDLAWTISIYELQFLIVITGYVLVRGLYNDFMEWLSELFIRRLRNGWLWTQALLKPLDKLLQLALFLLFVASLFLLYGWDSDSVVTQTMKRVLNFQLIAVEGVNITPLGIIQFSIAAIVLFWVARWTREFAYRWLFMRTRDLGVRNSLAAFTQYTTVALGLIVALKLIGVDFTAISYILTALAVGIGFGLRDLARNYVSGMLLLIERPVRAGDLISIGTFEGEVTNIGMRAMTVKTWDNMEVLVPNSEAFEKSFTNWTHQDSIVRTVITLKVHRDDNPLHVKQIVNDVLEGISDIVSDPEPQIFMHEIQDALLEMQVRYFINLQMGSSRAEVRSKVLYAIWERLHAEGIRAPNPQQEIYVKSLPQV